MVYCTKCGTLNPDTATNCSNCGAPLSIESRPYSRYERRRYYRDEYRYYHGGTGIGFLIAGLFIIIIGLIVLTGLAIVWNYLWPIFLVLLGIWLLTWGLRRNRRYRQAPPPP